MSRILLSIVFVGVLFSVKSQYNCNHKHHSTQLSQKASNTRSDTIDVLNYNVHLDITDYGNQKIAGSCEIQFVSLKNNVTVLDLDLLQMMVDSVTSQGQLLSSTYNDTLLSVTLPLALNIEDTSSVVVYYNGSPQGDPSGWGGWYFQGSYSYNLGVGFDANPHNYGRVWHPCFDNFVERATYDFSILTNAGKTSYANGYIVNDQVVGIDSLVRTWRMDSPIPTYLACIAVGNYTHVYQDYVSSVTANTTPVFLISEPADTNNFKASFTNLHGAIEAFEEGYGPYLWDKVGFHLVPFNSGAMEHATSIAYPRSTANGALTYETLMAHELAHHWWGNLVTCRTAEDMWINEGMASYSERLFLEYLYGYDAYINDIKLNHKDVLHHAHISDDGYFALSGVPHQITYGDHSYNKGADVAHALRGYLGDSLFFMGLKSFLAANVYQDVDATDFMDHLNTINGIDVTDFFNDWIFNPGFPHFSIDSTMVSGSGGIYTVDVFVKQKLKSAPNFYSNVPLEITFMDDDWQEYTASFMMSGQSDNFQFTVPFSPVTSYLNGADKISQAVTGENVEIIGPGIKDKSYPMFKVTTTAVADSAFLRLEHHWVSPDPFKDNLKGYRYSLSQERYWRVVGLSNIGFEGSGRIFLNGTTSSSGNLDNNLVAEPGFTEDSLRVFYRVNTAADWEVVSGYSINTLGSATNGNAYINIDVLLPGEYTFGWEYGYVGIEEEIVGQVFNIYPNPAQEIVNIDLSDYNSGERTIGIYDMKGKLLKHKISVATQIFLDISDLSNGQYLISVLNAGKFIGSKILVKN
jgi:hypothetical protein